MTVEQKTRDITLAFDSGGVDLSMFTIFRTQKVEAGKILVTVHVIGESHIVDCSLGRGSFHEILACTPTKKMGGITIPAGMLSRFTVEPRVVDEGYEYRMEMKKLGFDDGHYLETFEESIAESCGIDTII